MVRVTPSEAFVETLVAHGVKHVFGIVGSAFMDALDLFPSAGIRFVSVAHEQNAGHMADGYARVTNRHGVCTGQHGPGVTNFVTSIAAAYWAHSPVVAVTPQAGSLGIGLGGFQETDQMPIFSEITKYQVHVNSPSRMAELTDRALKIALFERGPVQINIPRDYFYGDIEVEIPDPQVVGHGAGDPAALQEAAAILAEAKFPVMLVGGGVPMAGGVEQAKALAEYLGCPVAASYLHNDSFPASHEQFCGPVGYQGSKAAMRLIAKADVVLALGTRLGPFGTLPQYGLDYWPSEARIVQVDTDRRVLGFTKKVTLGICGDARQAAEAILERLRETQLVPGQRDRLREIAAAKRAWAEELGDWTSNAASEEGRIAPRQALAELAKARPKNAVVSTDIGNVCSVANSYLQFEEPLTFLAAMSWGNCGYAYPAAMGAKVAAPERPAVAYVGDGAWGMSMAETMTCVRENIPVVAVVFNNMQWGAEKKNQIDYFNSRFVGTNLTNPNFADVARAMGAEASVVSHRDQVGDALREAIESGKPTVLDVRLTRELAEPFRRDAFRQPVRFLEQYEHLTGTQRPAAAERREAEAVPVHAS